MREEIREFYLNAEIDAFISDCSEDFSAELEMQKLDFRTSDVTRDTDEELNGDMDEDYFWNDVNLFEDRNVKHLEEIAAEVADSAIEFIAEKWIRNDSKID